MQILCSFPAVLLTRLYIFKRSVRDSQWAQKTTLPKLVFKNRLGNKACCISDKTDFIFIFALFVGIPEVEQKLLHVLYVDLTMGMFQTTFL